MRSVTLSHASLIGAGRSLPVAVSGRQTTGTRILGTGPAFFNTMQIPVRQGRAIDERDQLGSPRVAVVSELFATTFLGPGNVVGRYIDVGNVTVVQGGDTAADALARGHVEVVGVAANAQYGPLKTKAPAVVYLPFTQNHFTVQEMTYALRTAADPLRVVGTVREIVHRADARIPLTKIRTQAAEIEQTINQELVFAQLCTGFAILALVIAAVGLYGTMSYGVARRTSEIGIRMALGAERRTVVWLVLREGVLLVLVGLAISVPLALGTSRFVASFLFQMKPNDPLALAFAVTILASVALVAGYLPARRASRIDPPVALRHE